MKQKMKSFLGILLSFVLMLTLVPETGMMVYAATETYTNLIPTGSDDANTLASKVVKFNGIDWYIIADESTAVNAGTVTLFAKDPIYASEFYSSNSSNYYSSSLVISYLDGLTTGSGSFAGVADAIETISTLTTNRYNSNDAYNYAYNVKLYLLSTEEANNLPENIRKCSKADGAIANVWWLRSPGPDLFLAACVVGQIGGVEASGHYVNSPLGVRPALMLNLSSVIFSSESKTFLIPQTVSANDVTVTYGDTDKCVSANVTVPSTGGGAISYAVKTGSEEYIEVNASTGALTIKKVPADGKAYVTVTAAENAICTKATREVTVTISKADGAKAPTAKSLTYNGQAQVLVNAGDSLGGTMLYALGNDATTAPDADKYTTSIPTGTNAGTYYVWYKVVGDENQNDVAPAYVKAVIGEQKTGGNTTGSSGSPSGGSSGGSTSDNTDDKKDDKPKTTEPVVTTNPDGSKTTTTTTTNTDGSTTKKEETVGTDGKTSTVETTVKKETDGTVVTNKIETDPDGSKTTTVSKESTDGSKTVSSVTESKDGSVTKTEQVVNTDGSSKQSVTVENTDGSKSSCTIEKAAGGTQTITTESVTAGGKETTLEFKADAKGNVKLASFESDSKKGVIPDTVQTTAGEKKVTEIGKGAFEDSDIKEVTIGENIKNILPKAFKDAENLKKININAKKLKKVGKGAFDGIADGAVIKIRANAKTYKKTVKMIKKSGISDTVRFKCVKGKKK